MGSFRFIHAADLHLDSPMRGLTHLDPRWLEIFGQATRQAFRNLVDAAFKYDVSFVILAGDLFDGDWKDFRTGLFFTEEIGRLDKAGIETFIVFGNHDAAGDISARLPERRGVHIFPRDAAGTALLPALNVAVHGRGYGRRDEKSNLARTYPDPVAGAFNIGVLHTAAEGREGHDAYAPCDVADLLAKGYDYWALGHVHKREILNQQPPIVFSGNLQGRHANERGAKGAYLVEVGEDGRSELEFLELDVARWQRIELDAGTWRDRSDFSPALAEPLADAVDGAGGRPVALRVIIQGETDLHGTLLDHQSELEEELAYAIGDQSGEILLEQLALNTRPPVRPRSWAGEDVLARLLDYAADAVDDPMVQEELTREFTEMLRKLPSETPGKPNDSDLPLLMADGLALLRSRLSEGDG